MKRLASRTMCVVLSVVAMVPFVRDARAADMTYQSTVLSIGPYADVSATYDSNPDLVSRNEDSDVFYEGTVGLDLQLNHKLFVLDLGGYLRKRDYVDGDPGDLEDSAYGERAGLSFGERRKLAVSIKQSYEHVTDYSRQDRLNSALTEDQGNLSAVLSEDRSERQGRDMWDAGIGLGRDITDKIGLDVVYNHGLDDYADDALRDSERYTVSVETSYDVTDKSAMFLHGRYGVENSDGFEGEAESLSGSVGWKTRITHKVNFKGSVGVDSYDSGKLVGRDEESDRTEVAFNVGCVWRPVDALSLNLAGSRKTQAAVVEANTREVTLVGVGAMYRLRDNLSCSLGVTYRTDNYDLLVQDSTESREVDAMGVNAGVNYRVSDNASLSAAVSYEDSDSNLVGEDLTQTRASIGLYVKY